MIYFTWILNSILEHVPISTISQFWLLDRFHYKLHVSWQPKSVIVCFTSHNNQNDCFKADDPADFDDELNYSTLTQSTYGHVQTDIASSSSKFDVLV